jgi:spore germination protein
MHSTKRLLGHPFTLIPFAIGLGLLIHYWTGPSPKPRPAPQVTENLPPADLPTQFDDPSKDAVEGFTPAKVSPAATAPATATNGESEAVEVSAPIDPELLASETDAENVAPEDLSPSATTVLDLERPVDELPTLTFQEIWGYLMSGDEHHWQPSAALSDVVLFGIRLDQTGKLIGKIRESTFEAARARDVRVHLAIASSGQAGLMHFLLNPRYGDRDRFISDIVALTTQMELDGLQLDFESLRVEDRKHFESFLRDLRSALPQQLMFTLAIPARDRDRASDAFAYADLADLADRFLIMVYDEHWKGGPPGSVSSGDWNRRVTAHSLRHFPTEKLIIGLPFYGRLWQLDKGARATRHSDLADLSDTPGFEIRFDASGGHRIRFRREIEFEGWFEDAWTCHAKMKDALELGAQHVGFWRLGQEDARVWKLLALAHEE